MFFCGFIKKLENVGIQCRVFNPFMPGLNVFLNNRDHRKITVIDGKIGFTGGYNLANEYFNFTHPYGQWKDTRIRLEGDAVRSLTITFLEMWNAVNDKDKNDTDFEKYLLPYEYHAEQSGFCHAKMSVADDCMATCGTINLDYRSLYHHFENGCFMADCSAVTLIREDLEATMKECCEVTEKYSSGNSAYLRLGQLFMRLFAGLL